MSLAESPDLASEVKAHSPEEHTYELGAKERIGIMRGVGGGARRVL